MSKYRNHISRRHDILLGYTNSHVPNADPDFTEEDVWTTTPDYNQPKPNPNRPKPKQMGRTRSGGLSMAFDPPSKTDPTTIHQCRRAAAAAAAAAVSLPMDVPEWSRMARVESSDSMNCSVELDPDESEWVPPHEYLAREHGKSVTTSVFEGAGRTLKGRDLRRVRDAVWSQTGFFG